MLSHFRGVAPPRLATQVALEMTTDKAGYVGADLTPLPPLPRGEGPLGEHGGAGKRLAWFPSPHWGLAPDAHAQRQRPNGRGQGINLSGCTSRTSRESCADATHASGDDRCARGRVSAPRR